MDSLSLLQDSALQLYQILLSLFWQSTIFLGGMYVIIRLFAKNNPLKKNWLWQSSLLLLPLIPVFSFVFFKYFHAQGIYYPPLLLNSKNLTWMSMEYINGDLKVLGIAQSQDSIFSILSNPVIIVAAFYSLILAFLFIQLVLSYGKLAIWKKSNERISESSIYKLFNDAAFSIGIKQKITIYQNSRISVPLTFGIFSPVVLIPTGIIQNASMDELKGIAIHELSHVKRLDTLSFSYASIIKVLFFFQPLVWIATREMMETAEEICDGEAITKSNTPLAYAKLLSRIAEQLPKRSFCMNTSPSFMSGKKNFVRRIKTILAFDKNASRSISRRYSILLIAVMMLPYTVAMRVPMQLAGPEVYNSPDDEAVSVIEVSLKMDIASLKDDIHPILFPISESKEIAISNKFGDSVDPFTKEEVFHNGIDIRVPEGASVMATAEGVVSRAREEGGHGNRIIIDHADGFQTRYTHLGSILVKEGDKVKANQKIGSVGMTGRTTGPHLHYEIRLDEKPIDPIPVINRGDFLKKLETLEFNGKVVEADDVDVLPEMKGGVQELYAYMGREKLYPEEARKEKIDGEVTLNFVVNEKGKVTLVTIQEESPKYYGFANASIIALRAMKFTPGMKNGKKVPVKMQQKFRFRLS